MFLNKVQNVFSFYHFCSTMLDAAQEKLIIGGFNYVVYGSKVPESSVWLNTFLPSFCSCYQSIPHALFTIKS